MLEHRAGVHIKGEFSLFDLMKNVRAGPNFSLAGAITVFIGVVRGEDVDGDRVEKLEMQAYEEKANEVLNSICDDLAKKPGITDVQIHHLLGEFEVGEDLVYVLVAGSHRKNIFPVLRKAVERYKKEAPIFKKETVITKKGKRTGSWLTENHTPSTR